MSKQYQIYTCFAVLQKRQALIAQLLEVQKLRDRLREAEARMIGRRRRRAAGAATRKERIAGVRQRPTSISRKC